MTYGANSTLSDKTNTDILQAVKNSAEPTIGVGVASQNFITSVTDNIKNTITDTTKIQEYIKSE